MANPSIQSGPTTTEHDRQALFNFLLAGYEARAYSDVILRFQKIAGELIEKGETEVLTPNETEHLIKTRVMIARCCVQIALKSEQEGDIADAIQWADTVLEESEAFMFVPNGSHTAEVNELVSSLRKERADLLEALKQVRPGVPDGTRAFPALSQEQLTRTMPDVSTLPFTRTMQFPAAQPVEHPVEHTVAITSEVDRNGKPVSDASAKAKVSGQ